ncbi:hypothetical protein JCM6882_000431 [Rhodosporidiobolus microsporus]
MPLHLGDTSYLPKLRLGLYSLLTVSSFLLFAMSLATLVYQLIKTYGGYNKPIPSLLTCSALTLVHCGIFLSHTGPSSSPKRRKLVSIQVELLSLAVFTLFTLASVARLHSSTPGLLSACSGYFTCSALQGCLALAWLSFLFLALLFASILLATLYHHRRCRDPTLWREPFSAFDWAKYDPHGSGRAEGRIGLPVGRGVGFTKDGRESAEGSARFSV